MQFSVAIGQRVWNTHPFGGFTGLGSSPVRIIRSLLASMIGSGMGIAERSALVYGCKGFEYYSARSAISTICPRYITATRSLMWLTTDRSCEMNK